MSDVRHYRYKTQVQVVITMSLFEIRDLGVIIRFSQKKARIESKSKEEEVVFRCEKL